MGEINPEITDQRKVLISFNFPFFSRYNCIYTEIHQRDLIKIIRQIKDIKLQTQLKNLIKEVDENNDYETDFNQKVSKTNIRKDFEREIIHVDEMIKK